jgi:hypothetical protein
MKAKNTASLTSLDISFYHGFPLFDDVKQVHTTAPTFGEPQLPPLLLVRALELGGVFKRDLNGKTTSNEELEENLYSQSLLQRSLILTHSFERLSSIPVSTSRCL